MRKSLGQSCGAALLVLAGLWPAVAAEVDHHGNTVTLSDDPADCLACHDGNVAQMVSSCTVKCNFRTSHAILRSYPPTDREAEFSPVGELPGKGIHLLNGKVVCTSCHNLQNPTPRHLVVTVEGSSLCLSCHRK